MGGGVVNHNLQLNLSKCSILHRQIDYLSHTISLLGVKPNKEKIQAIIHLCEPTTLAAANKFIGGISWYRKFIPQFASVAAPIIAVTNLTKPNRKNPGPLNRPAEPLGSAFIRHPITPGTHRYPRPNTIGSYRVFVRNLAAGFGHG